MQMCDNSEYIMHNNILYIIYIYILISKNTCWRSARYLKVSFNVIIDFGTFALYFRNYF